MSPCRYTTIVEPQSRVCTGKETLPPSLLKEGHCPCCTEHPAATSFLHLHMTDISRVSRQGDWGGAQRLLADEPLHGRRHGRRVYSTYFPPVSSGNRYRCEVLPLASHLRHTPLPSVEMPGIMQLPWSKQCHDFDLRGHAPDPAGTRDERVQKTLGFMGESTVGWYQNYGIDRQGCDITP